MPTMDDVAKASGFSQMTVSRAFDRSASIREVTRKRILEAAAAIGYYHNRAAAIVASRRSRSFGIVLPTLQSSIYLPFVEAARRAFEHRRADYVLQTIDYARGREVQVIGALLSHRVEAILLPSIGHTGKTRRLLQNVPVPLIEVGNLPQEPIHFAVGHSDFDAGAVATERLIAMGCRRVAIICGHARTTSNARDRLEGYRHALQGAGLPAADERRAEVDHSIELGPEGPRAPPARDRHVRWAGDRGRDLGCSPAAQDPAVWSADSR